MRRAAVKIICFLMATYPLILFAESSTNVIPPRFDENKTKWSIPVDKKQKSIKIKLVLPRRSGLILTLRTSDSTSTWSTSTINISSAGCTTGHRITISTQKTTKDIEFDYFKKEIPWEVEHTLQIEWINEKSIRISVDNEMIETPILSRIFKLEMNSKNNPPIINSIETTKQ